MTYRNTILKETIKEWAEEYSSECKGSEYFNEDHFIEFIYNKLKEKENS